MPQYQFFSVCPRNLEDCLVSELASLGARQIHKTFGGASFVSDTGTAMEICLQSRISSRLLMKITSRICETEDELYSTARRISWEKCFDPESSIRVDVTAHKSPLESIDFAMLRIKDGICDRFRSQFGTRPSVDKTAPDVRIHVYLDGTTATFYFNIAGDPLFKRGWRLEKGEAPLKENLAAGLLALAQWDIKDPLQDIFCGSGTIAIEAAQKALNIAPGLHRNFVFSNLSFFDKNEFAHLKEAARLAIRPDAQVRIHASDISSIVVRKAADNALRAGLGALLEDGRLSFEVQDARHSLPCAPSGLIISNPPYGEQSNPKSASVASMMKDIADNLKRNFPGWTVWFLSSDRKLPGQMRLKESRKIELYNGPLECRFFRFNMVTGSFRTRSPVPEHQS